MKKLMLLSLFLVIGYGMQSCAPEIVDKPIVFNQERLELSKEYMESHYGLIQDEPSIEPKMVVVHWTAIPTFEKSFEAFADTKLPNWRPEIAGAGALNVSSHFLVDRDGTIYRLMPETIMARHVIGLNHCAIGIENVGGTDDTPLTDAQLKANIDLIDYLSSKYDISYVIGHHEYRNFEGHPLWMEKDQGYRTEKSDPGDVFMSEIRNAFEPNKFKEIPNN
ncbi:N-acetylmuramoyl-L-alanine amidase [Robertkochia marina]|uniref:N-acetylmuramoyl-L-alanine amidase n=1 Tax=Robertkochia marina TaxID=1227945 RepID=A0A4S3M442_9FLAO|nr:peptidoglycan recognition family protein [Robertkochia marina]THD69962.1 N-acetylmuramoyl-L-alanine amidase [Robertkochia marina]TRZ46693.1 N-acetylmuramoyl-L-alanine amidase [Robertkochia marina]